MRKSSTLTYAQIKGRKSKATYAEAIEWIAFNDESGCMDVAQMQGLISVVLVSDLYDVPEEIVAHDVVAVRRCATTGLQAVL